MTTRLAACDSVKHANNFSMVGGKGKTPHSLAARMPSPEIAAKVGTEGIGATRAHRVVRRNARA